MDATSGVIITSGDLDTDDRGVILTGFLQPGSLSLLKADSYQREELSQRKIMELMKALQESRVPGIELGMRGGDEHVTIQDDGVVLLNAPVYIVDGLQRSIAASRLIDNDPTFDPRLQVTVHLNTDFQWERKRFQKLNLGQTKVGGNVTLRNLQHDFESIKLMLRLSKSPSFVLGKRIAWGQSMKRGELISGVTFTKMAGQLHRHVAPGGSNSDLRILSRSLDGMVAAVGTNVFQQNIKTFYEVVNDCWGIDGVVYRSGAIQLKVGFLRALAKVFSSHTNFWDGNRLVVDTATRKKLGQFPMRDTTVMGLANQTGTGSDYLSQLLADHINSGRRVNRLVRRDYSCEPEFEEQFETEVAD